MSGTGKNCNGCGKPIALDDDVLKPANALLHDRPECVASHLESLKPVDRVVFEEDEPAKEG